MITVSSTKPSPGVRVATVAKGLERYRSAVSILKKGYEQEKYRISQIQRSPLAIMNVHEVTSVDIAAYRDARLVAVNAKTGAQISPATVRLELSLLSSFFDIARIEWGYTSGTNPCADVRKPKPSPGRDRRLTPREERLIYRYAFSHVNPELYSIIVVALGTAMRQAEILSLRWEHINLRSRIAHLPATKNGTKRDVPLSSKVCAALTRMGARTHGRVFTYTSSGIKSTWRFMRLRLGIDDLHFHDLRHEAISKLFELGTLDMMEIAAISGHKSLAMLKRYTHLRANRLVHKLEGTRSKARMAVIRDLVPYPAVLSRVEDSYQLHFPDFGGDDVLALGATLEAAKEAAQDVLLRTLVRMMRAGDKLPNSDSYLETYDESDILLVDPMAEV